MPEKEVPSQLRRITLLKLQKSLLESQLGARIPPDHPLVLRAHYGAVVVVAVVARARDVISIAHTHQHETVDGTSPQKN